MEYFKHNRNVQGLHVQNPESVRMSDLFSQRFKSKFPRILECCSQLQCNMTIAMENAQLFGEKYDHLNGADT